MGVDVTHIIRHNFKGVRNHEAAVAYIRQTIERLKQSFCINCDDEYFECRLDDIEDMSFVFPPYDFTFFLRDGFWQIEPIYHYCHLLMPVDDVLWLHQQVYDVAKALGENEAWHAEEFYTWNCAKFNIETDNFDKWIKFAEKCCKKGFPEFIPEEIKKEPDFDIPIYHDSFIGCKERFDELQKKINGYRLLGIGSIIYGFLQCEKNGRIYLIDSKTFKLMDEDSVDVIIKSYNGVEFLKDGHKWKQPSPSE